MIFPHFVNSIHALIFVTIVIASPALAQSKTAEMLNAADKFLATLNPEQRQGVLYAYDDAKQRARWSNFPTGFVPGGGMSLKQMSAPGPTTFCFCLPCCFPRLF